MSDEPETFRGMPIRTSREDFERDMLVHGVGVMFVPNKSSDEPEMVERCALAMGAVYERYGQRGDLRTAGLSLGCLEAMARAAIAAMREPTLDMQRSGIYAQHGVAAKDVWDAMIAAALGEKKP